MLQLRGQRLTLEQIADVANGREQVGLSDEARSRIEASRAVVERIVEQNRTVYGVNTGFGKLSDVRIERRELRELQLNLVRSHSCGLGNPLSEAEARAMLLLRQTCLLAVSVARAPLSLKPWWRCCNEASRPSFRRRDRLERVVIWRRWPILHSQPSAKAKHFTKTSG